MRAIAVALGIAIGGACYSPSPPRGAPCGENDVCPAGQQCVAGFCGGSDVPMDDADVVVAPDQLLIDSAPLCTTWSARHFDPCMIPAPNGDLVLTQALSGYGWNTDSGELKGKMNTTINGVVTMVFAQVGGPDVMLASVNNFTLEAGANLSATGNRPLLIVVWGTATIAGNINLDSSFNTPAAAGATTTTTQCPASPTGNSGGAGPPPAGGGGGAFQGGGGRGGNTSSGAGVALAAPTVVQGGCAGGLGGSGGGGAATRGAGGGAIQLTARVAIDIQSGASISAGGGAGRGGIASLGGGGGGGSGGYIGLDAPTVTIAGTVAANGGGGGGGASDVANGSAGTNAVTSASEAAGGNGASVTNVGACGRGGNGSGGGDLTGDIGGSSNCGGAGGGGGAGYVLIWSPAPNVTGIVSPPALGGP